MANRSETKEVVDVTIYTGDGQYSYMVDGWQVDNNGWLAVLLSDGGQVVFAKGCWQRLNAGKPYNVEGVKE